MAVVLMVLLQQRISKGRTALPLSIARILHLVAALMELLLQMGSKRKAVHSQLVAWDVNILHTVVVQMEELLQLVNMNISIGTVWDQNPVCLVSYMAIGGRMGLNLYS